VENSTLLAKENPTKAEPSGLILWTRVKAGFVIRKPIQEGKPAHLEFMQNFSKLAAFLSFSYSS
jgi:hypothetical protein